MGLGVVVNVERVAAELFDIAAGRVLHPAPGLLVGVLDYLCLFANASA